MTDNPRPERYVCTAEAPWTPELGRFALHPDAKFIEDEDHDGGTCSIYDCPNCGKQFHVELPD